VVTHSLTRKYEGTPHLVYGAMLASHTRAARDRDVRVTLSLAYQKKEAMTKTKILERALRKAVNLFYHNEITCKGCPLLKADCGLRCLRTEKQCCDDIYAHLLKEAAKEKRIMKMCKYAWLTKEYGLRCNRLTPKCPANSNSHCEIVPKPKKDKVFKAWYWKCLDFGPMLMAQNWKPIDMRDIGIDVFPCTITTKAADWEKAKEK